MPVVAAWIGEMLLTVVGRLAVQALLALGIGFIASSLTNSTNFKSLVASHMAGAGAIGPFIGWTGLGTGITVLLSALAGRAITSAVSKIAMAKLPGKGN